VTGKTIVPEASESTTDSAHAAIDAPAEPRTRRRLVDRLEALALPGLLVLAALFFTVYGPTSKTFMTAANLQVLVGGQAVVALVALALLVPLCANEWDLSVGAVAGLSAVFAASVMSSGSLVGGVLVGLGLGAAVGLANALIVTRFKVNAVITTLGMMTIVDGIVDQKSHGTAIVSNIPQSLVNLGSENWLGVPRIAIVLAVIAIAVHYLLEHTPYGRYLYAYGSNPTAARLVGLRTRLLTSSTFVVAGVLAASAGILAVARSGGASPTVGDQLLLPAFAAAFLSAASIKPGRYNVGGLLIAVYFLAVINNGLSLAGAQPYISSYINGGALIIGVGLAAYLGRRRRGE
jgi:ribose transport system permease protein